MGVYSLLIFLADRSSYSEDITISKIVSVNVRSATLSEEKSRHKPLSVKKKKIAGKKFRHWQNNSLLFTEEFFLPGCQKTLTKLKKIINLLL